MTETDNREIYDILQVSPVAEPEVVAAAYRALAKKYHPDRSDAPDAMNRMSRLNIAYQKFRVKLARQGNLNPISETPVEPVSDYGGEKIDISGNLEDVFKRVGERIDTARYQLVDEVVKSGISREQAMNLVMQAIRETFKISHEGNGQGGGAAQTHIDPNSSYDAALKATVTMATAARDGVADALIHDGLPRGAATDLADAAFERIRKGRETTQSAHHRLSADKVDLSGSLERGVDVVVAKTKIARQMIVDEIAQDGVPVRTAEQLVKTAFEKVCKNAGK